MVELWRIYNVLSLAWEANYHKVWVESVSAIVVGLGNAGCSGSHPYATIVQAIEDLKSKSWEYYLSPTFREANMAADFPYAKGHNLSLGLHV